MFYKVSYGSMYEARRKFAGTAFSQREMPLIKATLVSSDEVRRALRRQNAE